VADSQVSLLEQVRSGANRQLQILAAGGLLPLPLEQLIPLQVDFARGGDPELSGRAAESLRQLDPHVAALFLERAASERELTFFAHSSNQFQVLETIVRRRDVPRRLLAELARRVSPDLQEILVLRQDAIVEEPAILDALEGNPELTPYAQRRITEYRQHLLPQSSRGAARAAALAVEEMEEAELQVALAHARALPAEGEVEQKTGLSEGQIRMLPVPARLKLSRGASRVLRHILLRDPSPAVAVSVLVNNSCSDQEIEQVAGNRSVVEEVLAEIAKRREWMSKYLIVKALIQNPRTPIATSVRLVPRLSVRDMRYISRDRNLPDAVRSTALRLYRIKQK
jgi:hypothetical protein